MKQPKTYTFSDVNDFVHSMDTEFEDLQCACLGMAAEIERLKKEEKLLDWLEYKHTNTGVIFTAQILFKIKKQ
ncbi:MAG: hypothetical protein PHW03_05415 [Eubacteriales bacterium]|nr:hypothetical protein [Eubacteriales bacterium]